MTGKHYRFCIVGAGRMGSKWAQIVLGNRQTQLALVVDSNRAAAARLAKQHQAAPVTSLSAKVLWAHSIDAVIIAVPHKYLFANAKIALGAGVHTLIEKPGARTELEMRTLMRLAQKKRVKLMIGFNYRFFDAIRQIKKLVASGRIGAISFIRIRHGHPGRPGYNKEWRMNRQLAGGGVLMDQGTHVIDLVNWFLPAARYVAGAVGTTFWKSSVEDNAAVLLRSQRGQLAQIHVSITQWKPIFSLEIFGTKGYCLIDGLGNKYGGNGHFIVGKLGANQKATEKKIACDKDPDNSFRHELAAFIKSLASDKNILPTGQDALRVLEVVDKVYGK